MPEFEDRRPRLEELSFDAYRTARERFLARLRADSEARRLIALRAAPIEPGDGTLAWPDERPDPGRPGEAGSQSMSP